MDGHHVVFGQVLEGFDVLTKLEKIGSMSGMTSKPATIWECGVV